MTERVWSSEPTNELERLIAELAESGSVVFVFGVGWWTAHLVGTTSPTFGGEPAERRWHVEVGDERGKWVMDVKLNQISSVQFVREPNPFPHFPGHESLTVRFAGSDPDSTIYCYLGDLYDDERRLRPDKLGAWTRLRDQYGGRVPA
jgi:hypothetical protein